MPTYRLGDFLQACEEGVSKVFISKGAMETASVDFNLNTQSQVLQFIGNNGLDKLGFINTKIWLNNPHPECPIMTDAYGFFSGSKYGYISFLFYQKSGKWLIKSFKKNKSLDLRNFAFEGLQGLLNRIEEKIYE